MAGAPVQVGPNSVTDPQALISALQSQAPPANPTTLPERLNPDKEALEKIKAAAVSLGRAQEFTNDQSMLLVLDAMEGVLNKALLRFDGQSVLQALQQAVAAFPPMIAPPIPTAAPPQPGIPMGAIPPGGMPPPPMPGPPGPPLQ